MSNVGRVRALATGPGIIATMTDRATPGDGSPACPFIAFEDERDERSASPDHRHRCFAEVRPAPRAVAHQEAYCLSSAFPVCPTFQDWARREAAKAKSPGRPASSSKSPRAAAVIPPEADAADEVGPDEPALVEATHPMPDDSDDDLWSRPPADDVEPVIHRNPPRDWAAPPPWASGAAITGVGRDDAPSAGSSERRPGAGLAGSAADRLASGYPVEEPAEAPASPPSDDLAVLVAAPRRAASQPPPAAPIKRPPSGRYPTTSAAGRRPSVSATREHPPGPDHDGPSWERARRYEAYPTIKTRAGLPGIPRLGIWAGALVVAALALFFLPGLFEGDPASGPGASPTPSASPSEATPVPTETPVPSPTPEVYVIKKGDTLSKIAKKFGVTVDDILEANKDTIKDPNKIRVGDEIIIPVAPPDEIVDPSAENPEASPTP